MTALTIRPPNQAADGHTKEWPHVFLAGPIQGAPDWQKEAVTAMHHRKVVIANPRCRHRHDDYNGQVDWELRNLQKASINGGAVFFWLAKPDPDVVQPPGRAYAQTSRFELGEWVGRFAERREGNLVIGIEAGFTNERYIRRRLSQLYVCPVIPSTLGATLEVLRSKMGWP
jgi:hypothetical protein